MHRSLNEIEKTVLKAGLGTGWPQGLAEETAQAAAWLVALGLDGVTPAVESFEAGFRHAEAERDEEAWRLMPGPVAATGPSALDLLVSGRTVVLTAVPHPLLLAGLAGVRLWGTGGLLLESGTGDLLVGHAGLQGPIPPAGSDIALGLTADGPPPAETAPADAAPLFVDEALWRRVEALAARTYVPANPTSRAGGAGAGDIDNE